jgi:hypothetical protein
MAGKDSQYAIGLGDSEGNYPDGNKYNALIRK